jgi:8-oxo-dGTP pyrophosphatase MutT (NUDIX family)
VLNSLLADYQPASAPEAAEVARMIQTAGASDPWSRALPLHFTASAVVVHPPTRRVLLRWHARLAGWLQVGGHGDPGERDPLAIALREAAEETGLSDLVPWPDAALRHAVLCDVPASDREPAHVHADLRFVLATGHPEAIAPEDDRSPLRWLTLDEARALTGEGNLLATLERVGALLDADL